MIAYRDALPGDGPDLAAMAARSFIETFGTLYRPADLRAFLDQAFGQAGLPSQLDRAEYRVRLALDAAAIVGFAKLGPVAFPGDWPDDAIELHQLYVLGAWQGEGVGPALIDWAVAEARRMRCREIVLSVFVDNHRARRFYERRGFVEFGAFAFAVGEKIDDDRLLRLVL